MIIAKVMGSLNESFRVPTKVDIPKPYISDHDFRSTNVNDAGEDDSTLGHNLYVFDIRYQRNLEAAQPIKVELDFLRMFLLGYMVML